MYMYIIFLDRYRDTLRVPHLRVVPTHGAACLGGISVILFLVIPSLHRGTWTCCTLKVKSKEFSFWNQDYIKLASELFRWS